MPSSEKQRLLNEVVENRDFEAFRKEMFQAGLAELRRSRSSTMRTWRRSAIAVSLVASLVVAGIIFSSPRQQPKQKAETPKPSKSELYVESTPLDPKDIVRSVADRGLMVRTTRFSSPSLAIVETRSSVPMLDDAELLGLFPGRPAGFIRTAGHVELVLLDRSGSETRAPEDGIFFPAAIPR
jgi:hypothetical protein